MNWLLFVWAFLTFGFCSGQGQLPYGAQGQSQTIYRPPVNPSTPNAMPQVGTGSLQYIPGTSSVLPNANANMNHMNPYANPTMNVPGTQSYGSTYSTTSPATIASRPPTPYPSSPTSSPYPTSPNSMNTAAYSMSATPQYSFSPPNSLPSIPPANTQGSNYASPFAQYPPQYSQLPSSTFSSQPSQLYSPNQYSNLPQNVQSQYTNLPQNQNQNQNQASSVYSIPPPPSTLSSNTYPFQSSSLYPSAQSGSGAGQSQCSCPTPESYPISSLPGNYQPTSTNGGVTTPVTIGGLSGGGVGRPNIGSLFGPYYLRSKECNCNI